MEVIMEPRFFVRAVLSQLTFKDKVIGYAVIDRETDEEKRRFLIDAKSTWRAPHYSAVKVCSAWNKEEEERLTKMRTGTLKLPRSPKPFAVDRNAASLAVLRARALREEEKKRLQTGRMALAADRRARYL
jgi:hypothetical protein